MNEQYIVLAGSPFDGFTHYGTFSSFDEAQKWADGYLGFNLEWWVAKLESVEVNA
jgi:hypothetical protein